MRKIIASLDIGDHTIKLVVGEMVKNKLNILACVDTISRGVKKGFIINPESAIEALEDVFKKAEEQIGLKITKVMISVPSLKTECLLEEGYTSINNEDGIIKSADIMKCLNSSFHNKVLDNREVVGVFPTKFLVDDSVVSDSPLGLKALKLKVKAVVITVPKKNITTIIKCL